MKINKVLALGILLVLIIPILTITLSAHDGEEVDESLPENIQKLIEYKHEQADFYFRNLSFFVAFLAGIIGLLTPCSLAILPAFFAYSFEGKKQITKMTSIFFLGFAPVFIIFGLIATFLGKSLSMFQQGNRTLVIIAGIFLILFGLMILFGKGFSGIQVQRKTKKTPLGIFLFGIFFAIGFTACMGPILIGILLIAGILQNYVYAGFLMLFYALGMFVPLFLISMFFDKFNFSKWMNNINRKLGFSITNLIAGILLIAIGLAFLIYGGTYFLDFIALGDITLFIYSIQEKIINIKFINYIGAVILIIFGFLLWRFLRKKKDIENEN